MDLPNDANVVEGSSATQEVPEAIPNEPNDDFSKGTPATSVFSSAKSSTDMRKNSFSVHKKFVFSHVAKDSSVIHVGNSFSVLSKVVNEVA